MRWTTPFFRHTGAVLFLAALLLLLGAGTAFAYPKDLEWRTLETAHFRLNYPRGMESMAEALARLSEQVHADLSPLLKWDPTFKTEVLLVDHTDSPNGWVNVYPYNRMVLYAVPPDRRSELNDYDDWFRSLVYHEHTHVLQLDTKSGLPRVINAVFGGIIHPNQYMPIWYTEGLAVFDESRFTAGGRERSSLFEMYIRMDAYENRFLEIDQIGGGYSVWPYGHVPYLYGAKFMQYLADKYGDDTFAALGYLYGRRVIPYAMNSILYKVRKDDYNRLYDEWKSQLLARYREDIERLKTLGITYPRYLTKGGENHDSPKLFPTGDRVLYFHNDEVPRRSGWAVLDLATDRWKVVLEADRDGGAAIAPDGRRVVTAQVVSHRNEYSFYDLYLHDLDRDESRRLTTGLRAREPSFAPDGRRLAFVRYQPGRSHMMILDVDSGDTWEPFPKASFDQVFSPVWSPDGRYLAFTGWRCGDFKDLYLFDFRTNRLSRLTHDRSLDMSPAWSPDGSRLLWSSDRTGIYNIYARDMESGREYQLTNVVGGAFSPMLTPDGDRLIFSGYHSRGYDLASIDLTPGDFRPAPQEIEWRPAKRYADPDVAMDEREYSPFPSLYPKHWWPTHGEDYAGTTLGIQTWGNDIAYNHSWNAEFDVGLESGDPTIGLSYVYRGLLPDIAVRAAHASYTLVDAGVDNGEPIDIDESRTSGSMSLAFRFRGRDVTGSRSRNYSHTLSMGSYFRYTRILNRFEYEPTRAPAAVPDTGLGSGFSFGWSYANREGHAQYIGTAAGRGLSVGLRAETELLGSDFNNMSLSGSYSEYIANPFVDQHVLALKFAGAMGLSDYKDRAMFYIGGLPERDFVSDLIRNNRRWGDDVRGYEPLSMAGDKYILFKSEYRFNVWNINRGVGTLPLFFRRLHMAPFFDAGYTWIRGFDITDTRKGVGGEVRLDLVAGFQMYITIRLGYQAGLDKDGIQSLYLALDNLF